MSQLSRLFLDLDFQGLKMNIDCSLNIVRDIFTYGKLNVDGKKGHFFHI